MEKIRLGHGWTWGERGKEKDSYFCFPTVTHTRAAVREGGLYPRFDDLCFHPIYMYVMVCKENSLRYSRIIATPSSVAGYSISPFEL